MTIYTVYYQHGAEVDLIIERGRQILCGIECKHKRGVSRRDLSGIKAFRDVYPKIPCFIVSPAETAQEIEGVSVLPPQEMLKKLERDF